MKKELSQISIVLYFNNIRGLKILKYLIKKKLKIIKIIVSKKNLNESVLPYIKKSEIPFSKITSINTEYNKKLIQKNDLILLCGFPYILKSKLIALSNLGILNCHAGLLPKYRGGSPLNWQLINNEKYFGISIIKINNKIDGGEIVSEKKFKLKKTYTIKDLHRIANNNFPKILYKSIIKIMKNKKNKKQPSKLNSYFPQRKPKDSLLKFNQMNFIEIDCFVRALQSPYPNAFIINNNKKILIKKVKKIGTKHSSGNILSVTKKKIYFNCKDAYVEASI